MAEAREVAKLPLFYRDDTPCTNEANRLFAGMGCEVNYTKAHEWLRKALDAKEYGAESTLCMARLQGYGVSLFTDAERRKLDVCSCLAVPLELRHAALIDDTTFANALTYWELRIAAVRPCVQRLIALCTINVYGHSSISQIESKNYRDQALKECPTASLYYMEFLETKDTAALIRAAELGHPAAMMYMGAMSVYPETCLLWYERAAATGYVYAQHTLGAMLCGAWSPPSGVVVPADRDRARVLLERAAASNDTESLKVLQKHFPKGGT